MAKGRMGALLGGCLLWWGVAATGWAAPTVAQMLSFRPKQEGIVHTAPGAAEQARCTVELVKGNTGSGWLLKDGARKPVRRYFDANADNKIDIWSYYLDGKEVYREIDSNYNNRVDQYRWLNAAGARWGVDANEDGKIDSWKMISPEEVSKEVLRAMQRRDYAVLQALMITDADMQMYGLSSEEMSRIRQLRQQASAKFRETLGKASVDAKSQWIHVEMAAPECQPADTTGLKHDLHRYPNAALLYQNGDKSEWLQLGELIRIGMAWRLVGAPVAGHVVPNAVAAPNAEIQPLLTQLQEIDKKLQGNLSNSALHHHYMARAELLDQLVSKVSASEKAQWLQQLADCLSMAAQNSAAGDTSAHQRLAQLKQQIERTYPASSLSAYVTYAEMTADNARRMQSAGPSDYAKLQKEWMGKLTQYVQNYPKSDNTPDALIHLGMLSELSSDASVAKKWYQMLAGNFPSHHSAEKAKGAVARLGLEGKPLNLSGTILGTGRPYDVRMLRGKAILVYYWASWNTHSAADFAKLKELQQKHAGKLAVVCVNLDNTAAEATAFLRKSPAPGVQIHEPGGENSRLAKQYGVFVLPTMFLAGKDGKVISANVQAGILDEELKKAIK